MYKKLTFEWDKQKNTTNRKSMAFLSKKLKPFFTMSMRFSFMTLTTPNMKNVIFYSAQALRLKL